MELETGLSSYAIEKSLDKFIGDNKILYNKDTKEIMLLNWMKYNVPNNLNAKICVHKGLLRVKYKEFLKILYDKCIEAELDVDKLFENIIIDENDKNTTKDYPEKVDELPVDVILNSSDEEIDIKTENEEIQDDNNPVKKEAVELCSNFLLYAPFTGELQAPYKTLPSNRIRSNKEKVINKKQELINKEEVVISKKEALHKSIIISESEIINKPGAIKHKGTSAAITNCDALKSVIKVFEENVHAITPIGIPKTVGK